MPMLRKTGVRSPWLPGPLNGLAAPSADALRQTVVIGAIVPALLLGNVTQFVSRPAPPEDVNWPARPALEIQGQQPIPGAPVWMPTPARVANTDPLRPPIVVSDPPDPTLLPSAPVWAPYPVRESIVALPDRLAFTQVVSGWTPQPGGEAISVGRITATPTDRVPITTRAIGPSVPVPGAIVLPIGIVHDGDRLPIGATVIGSPVPVPGSIQARIGRITVTPTDPIRPMAVVVNQPPIPPGVGGILFPPAKSVFIVTPTDATRIAIVVAELRGAVTVVDLRLAAIAEVRRALVAAELRIAVVVFDDRDGTP